MRIHYLNNIQLLALLTAFTACSSNDDVTIEGPKTPIELKVGVEGPQSRASVITDDNVPDKTYSAFGSATDIWMAMQSDYKSLSNTSTPDERDYQGNNKDPKYCVTYGTTGAANGTVNPVTISGNQIRYWDDAHARSSALSIWALAVPGKTGKISTSGIWNTAAGWGSNNPTKTIDWTIATAQDEATIAANDLCFSNNIADYSTNSNVDDRRMKYSGSTFDQGKLVFYHALSKITIKMVEGDGFNTTSTSDFNLASSITLNGFKVKGTFDVADGAFSSTSDVTTPITMYQKEKNAADMTLEALVMPGTDLSSAALTNAVSFSVDGNAFNVSSATLVEKLKAGTAGSEWNGIIEAGKNYVFTFRVSKTAVKVTATVKDWEVLNATHDEPKITVSTAYGQEAGSDNRTAFTENFSFLKSTALTSGYADVADAILASYGADGYTLSPAQYWPNHNTHYFFRGIWPVIGGATNGSNTPTGKVTDSAITVENVQYVKDTYPSDLMLGYPRTTSETCKAHGSTVAIAGICATEGDIRMNFQRVMSKVTVNLETSAEGSSNRVVFDENTTVEIVDGYTNGTILLSDGSSSFSGGKSAAYPMHKNGTSNVQFIDAVIPQTLEPSSDTATDNIKFLIKVTSTDGYVDEYETLLGVKSIKVEGNNITAWEPGKHYVYNLIITKTGIKVTATIKDWIEATGSTNIWM